MSAPPITPSRLTERITPLTHTASLLLRSGPWLLRGSLAIVLVWFGALKVAGVPTMPEALIAAITPPFLDADLLVVLSGWFEVALGVGLIVGRWVFPRWQPLVLAGIAAQLSATFLVLAVRPDAAFINGNPLALSVEGEYVVKNLVLLAAALALVGQHLAPGGPDMSEEDPLDPAPQREVRENRAASRHQVAADHHVATRTPSKVDGLRPEGSTSGPPRRERPDAVRRVGAGAHPDIGIHPITEPGSDFDSPRTID